MGCVDPPSAYRGAGRLHSEVRRPVADLDQDTPGQRNRLRQSFCKPLQPRRRGRRPFLPGSVRIPRDVPYPKTGTPTHVELTLGGFAIGLSRVEAAKRAHGVEAVPGSPAMSLTLWTVDLDRAFERLTKAGAAVVQPPRAAGDNNRAARFRDPDGNLIEIVAKAG